MNAINPPRVHNSSLANNSITKIKEQSPIPYLLHFCSFRHLSQTDQWTTGLHSIHSISKHWPRFYAHDAFFKSDATNLTSNSYPNFSYGLYELNERYSCCLALNSYKLPNAFDNWRNISSQLQSWSASWFSYKVYTCYAKRTRNNYSQDILFCIKVTEIVKNLEISLALANSLYILMQITMAEWCNNNIQ